MPLFLRGCGLAVALIVLGLMGRVYARDIVVDVDVLPGERDNFYQASGRFWIPQEGAAIRGILVLMMGTDSDGRYLATQAEWQEFARNEHLALLGCYFRGEGEPYEDASRGSGQALLNMISQAAERLKSPKLSRCPLALIGFSSGAMFAYNFACWMPERVAAFVSVKTGPIVPASNARVAMVPALLIVGERDSERLPLAAKGFLWQSAMHGHWAFAVEPGKGHDWTEQDSTLGRAYFHGVLTTGNSNSVFKNADEKHRISDLNHWQRRDLRHPERAEASNETDGASLVWLPDADSVATWQRFTMSASVPELASRTILASQEATFSISPDSVNLGVIDTSGTDSARADYSGEVVVTDTDGIDWSFISTDPRLRVSAEKTGANRYRLAIELRAAGLGTGFYHETIRVIPIGKGAGVQECALSVTGKIESSVIATPSSLYLGTLTRGQIIEKVVKISFRDANLPLKDFHVISSRPQFASAQVSKSHDSIICRFDGAKALGNQSGYYDIVSGQAGDLVRVTFIAFVSKTDSKKGMDNEIARP